jgi:hypothetical protein
MGATEVLEMLRSPRLASLLLLLLLAGCYSSGSVAPAPGEDPAREDLACAPSELALAWSEVDALGSAYHPVALEVAPGGALFATRSMMAGSVGRMADGTSVTRLEVGVADARWARFAELDAETRVVRVREGATRELVATIAPSGSPDGWHTTSIAAIAPDGSVAFVVECATELATSEASATLIAHRIGGEERRVALPAACGDPWLQAPIVVPAADGTSVMVAALREPGERRLEDGTVPPHIVLVRVDVESGETTRATLGDPTRVAPVDGHAHVGTPETPGIVAATLSADATTLLVSGRDGVARTLDAATLEEIGPPADATLVVANPLTYLPSVESPVALSRRAMWVAHVGESRSIVIRDATGAVQASLTLPFDDRDGDGGGAPMAIRFVRDGLLVASDRGVARFACGGVPEPVGRPSGALTLRVDSPSAAPHGERVPFVVGVENVSLPVVRWVEIGTMHRQGSLGPEVRAYAYADPLPATLDVRVGADDGLRSAVTTTTLRIE